MTHSTIHDKGYSTQPRQYHKCMLCRTWFKPTLDSDNKIINENFCESCLEGRKLIKLERNGLEKLWSEYSK